MDVQEFFAQSAGKWFVQRSHYNLDARAIGNGKSEIVAELLAAADDRLADLCQQAGLDPSQVQCGLAASWDTGSDASSGPRQTGSNLLAIAPDTPADGRFARTDGRRAIAGGYRLQGGALTLSATRDGVEWEERIWFANPNLRMRTVLKRDDTSQAAFYSEIRRMS